MSEGVREWVWGEEWGSEGVGEGVSKQAGRVHVLSRVVRWYCNSE